MRDVVLIVGLPLLVAATMFGFAWALRPPSELDLALMRLARSVTLMQAAIAAALEPPIRRALDETSKWLDERTHA